MNFGFQQSKLLVLTGDGLDDLLVDSLDYVSRAGIRYRCPIGGTTDGLSVPRCITNMIPAAGDASWLCGVLHDSAYRGQLQRWNGETWIQANLERKACDDLMLEAMESRNVGWFKRHLIYRNLRMFGGSAFNDNRSAAGRIRNQLQAV